jgi:hypothetical protein
MMPETTIVFSGKLISVQGTRTRGSVAILALSRKGQARQGFHYRGYLIVTKISKII